MNSEERVVSKSRKVLSRKVKNAPSKTGLLGGLLGGSFLGSMLPGAGLKKKATNLKSSIAGVPFGILIIIGGFVLTYVSVYSVEEYSKVVEVLDVKAPSDVKLNEELVMFEGEPTLAEGFSYEAERCGDNLCSAPALSESFLKNGIIYYDARLERMEQVEEKETKTETHMENGVEVEEEVEYTTIKEKWVEKSNESKWSELTFGEVKVDPTNAKTYFESEETVVNDIYIEGLNPDTAYVSLQSRASAGTTVGDTRLVLNFIPAEDLGNVTVVGEVNESVVDSGEPFIVADLDKDDLVETLAEEEQTSRLLLRIFAWLALTIGFMMVLGPVLSVLDFIPFVGGVANAVAFFVGALLSLVIVFMSVIVLKYWWAFLILLAVIVGAVVMAFMQNSKNKESAK